MKINKNYLKQLDKDLTLIPLTFDYAFKSIFSRQTELLKKFLILELDLPLNPDECEIILENSELPKENFKEYNKTIDIYVNIDKNIFVDVEINKSNFNRVKLRNVLYFDKMYSLMLESGDNPASLKEKVLFQLNLNTEDKSMPYGKDTIVSFGLETNQVYNNNKVMVLKYLEFYRKRYYNGIKLSDDELWLVALTSTTFTELYEVSSKFLSVKDRDTLMKEVIRVSKDKFILHEWEKDKLDELVISNSFEDGLEQGLEQGKEEKEIEIVKEMLKNGIDLNTISNITKKTIKEIERIQLGTLD